MSYIFITSFHPLISRNILSTKVPYMLKNRGYSLVLLVPHKKLFFFKTHYGDLFHEIIPIHTTLTRRDAYMRYLSLALLNTETLNIKRKTEMKGRGTFLARFFSGKVGLALFRFLEHVIPEKSRADVEAAFDAFKPGICFSTDVQNELDVYVLKTARERRIRTVGMVRSWDNLTSKGLIREIPAKLAVWNEIIKMEASQYSAIPGSRIMVIGIPHYDGYKEIAFGPKEDFLHSVGASVRKKIALFIPIGDRYLNPNTVDEDTLLLLDRILPEHFILFVRLPPGDSVKNIESKSFGSRVYIERPVTDFKTLKNTEINPDSDRRLAETVYHSDIIITGPSTMVIDSAYFNKPMILEGFCDDQSEYYKSIIRYYDYDNFIPVIESRAVRFPKNIDDLKKIVLEYDRQPAIDSDYRKNLALLECGYLDGKSSERLANVICDM